MRGPFEWTPERLAKARRLYVDDGRPPSYVAKCIGRAHGCTPALVLEQVQALGWDEGRNIKCPRLSPALIERVRILYVVEELAPEQIVERLGAPLTARKVRGLASRKGWSAARPLEVTLRNRAALAKLSPRTIAKRARTQGRRAAPPKPPKPPKALGDGRGIPDHVRAAIDAAVAAGRLTILPPGHAAGTTKLEGRFWTSGGIDFQWRTARRGAQ